MALSCRAWKPTNAPDLVEDATLRQYTYHVKQYIAPQLGSEKVSTLTKETVSAFRDRLLRKLSRGMARKIVETLKAILAEPTTTAMHSR